MSFLPWPQAVENNKGIFFSGWMWDFLKSCHERSFIRGITGIELVGKGFKVSHLGVIRVRRTFLPVGRENGVFGLGGVNPSGFRLR